MHLTCTSIIHVYKYRYSVLILTGAVCTYTHMFICTSRYLTGFPCLLHVILCARDDQCSKGCRVHSSQTSLAQILYKSNSVFVPLLLTFDE